MSLGEDGRSKKSASTEPPKKESGDQELPSKEKSSTPEPLETAIAEAGGSDEAKKLTDQKEATALGSGDSEQTSVAEQQDQEQGHREGSKEPGVCVSVCMCLCACECVCLLRHHQRHDGHIQDQGVCVCTM